MPDRNAVPEEEGARHSALRELGASDASLREQAKMLEAILSTTVAAIVQLAPDGHILYANPQGERVLGLNASAIMGRRYDDPEWRTTAPDGGPWPDEAQPFQRVMATREPISGVEHAIEWPDGRRRQLSINGAPLFDETGAISSVVFSIVDITERREAEEAGARLEDQLRHAQKLEALGTLAAGIAHDFNNVLTALSSNLDLAKTHLEAAHPARALVDEARELTTTASKLVTQILAFSRRSPTDRVSASLPDLVASGVDLIRPLVPAGVEIAVSLAPDTPRVLADPTQMHQVMMNLCINAAQAMPTGSGRIGIDVSPRTVAAGQVHGLPAGLYACLSVEDDGVGMDVATRERLFEPFFSTKARGHGTGLGLSVVDGIVRSHGGAITVSSEPGHGSLFRIYLPAAEAAPPARSLAPPSPAPSAPRRILFVEDQAAVLRSAARALQGSGHEVDAFTDPALALAAFEKDPTRHDAVVVDLNMPGMSGIDVARRVAKARPGIRIVITTGGATDNLHDVVRDLGADVLEKPYTIASLLDCVGG